MECASNKQEHMTMSYEFITPELAKKYLEHNNSKNRNISKGTVHAYANDILAGNWTEATGETISFGWDGTMTNGQHRCAAVIEANKGIYCWVCRGTDPNGIYDSNRRRSVSDQVAILRPDFEKVYKSTIYRAVVQQIVAHSDEGTSGRKITPSELVDFTDAHKQELDGFFLSISQRKVPKIRVAVVHLSLFMAYMNGVPMSSINQYYDVLCNGYGTGPEDFPVIAYRNYLLGREASPPKNLDEIKRCQYSLQKYLSGSCSKKTLSPKNLIYPYPWEDEFKKGGNESC